MTIGDHMKEWGGLPVADFAGPGAQPPAPLPEAGAVAWRISADVYDGEESWPESFARFLRSVDASRVRALVVGGWWTEDCDTANTELVELLVAAADRLPALRALFVGDVTYEECEISWIHQSDMGPLLRAYPRLEEFGVRGGEGLAFPPLAHSALRRLRIETGGLSKEVVRGVAASELPALEDLDLWLGTSWYGADAEVADLEPFLSGARLPSLRRLALRNSEIQSEIAAALAGAPVVARLSELDLSMGTFGDEGAAALLEGQPLTHLARLDLHHHFLSPEVAGRLRSALEPYGVEVDLSDGIEERGGREERYTAVAE
ncbi:MULTISPECIES: STM4015 family protein [unclassified Streptomyces]|uniref:STM4015 family protein n=1 Tax=unclassified Streptomyces TaxID=2593676 RepID=UPI00341105BC